MNQQQLTFGFPNPNRLPFPRLPQPVAPAPSPTPTPPENITNIHPLEVDTFKFLDTLDAIAPIVHINTKDTAPRERVNQFFLHPTSYRQYGITAANAYNSVQVVDFSRRVALLEANWSARMNLSLRGDLRKSASALQGRDRSTLRPLGAMQIGGSPVMMMRFEYPWGEVPPDFPNSRVFDCMRNAIDYPCPHIDCFAQALDASAKTLVDKNAFVEAFLNLSNLHDGDWAEFKLETDRPLRNHLSIGGISIRLERISQSGDVTPPMLIHVKDLRESIPALAKLGETQTAAVQFGTLEGKSLVKIGLFPATIHAFPKPF